MLALLLLACQAGPPPDVAFVRGGVLVRGAPADDATSRPLGADGWRLETRAWSPGETLTVAGHTFTAPAHPECLAVLSVPLGDVAAHIGAGGEPPDTDLAFSPRGDRLAVGTWRGEVLIVDAWTGRIEARRKLGEALVKRVAWSPDGATLFVVEQSPDAALRALEAERLHDRWSWRLADRVETSPPPAAADLYGAYQLPTAFDLLVQPDGGVIVNAAHGWPGPDGARRNRSQLLRFSAHGELVAQWPTEPAPVILQALRQDGDRLAVTVIHTADAPTTVPHGVVVVLDAQLRPQGKISLSPQGPLFPKPWVWSAFDLRGDRLLTGFGDGRVQVRSLPPTGVAAPRDLDLPELDAPLRVDVGPGVPTQVGGVPIAASVGFGVLGPDFAAAITSGTTVPFGAASPETRPPVPHAGANTLFGWSWPNAAPWQWSGEPQLEGLTLQPDGRALIVGGGRRQGDDRRDLFGATVLNPAASADEDRRITTCRTAAPVFFRAAATDDGRVAVVEHPWLTATGEVAGAWQLTLLR